MIVRELIETLSKMNPDAPVVVEVYFDHHVETVVATEAEEREYVLDGDEARLPLPFVTHQVVTKCVHIA